MHHILVMGAGKIGTLIAFLLAHSNDYHIFLADISFDDRHDLERIKENTKNLTLISLDAKDNKAIHTFLEKNKVQAIVSSLPYYCNIAIANIAKEFNLHYFDLTEDTHTTSTIFSLAQNATSAFVPQCGLAPGFISIVANNLMQRFANLDTVKLRVGALPINTSNALRYSLTWSTEGLINEYGNLCHAIENSKEVTALPLDDLEEIDIDGLTYEAFNTSGGLGSLAKSYLGKVKQLNYKTIRYPGHCSKMRFLMNDLKLNQDRNVLKHILETVLPRTTQDVVLVYVSVTGDQNHQFIEENYVKKFYPQTLHGLQWSAIQLTTASGICAVLDIVLHQPKKYQGFVKQEQFSLEEITANRFGKYFTSELT